MEKFPALRRGCRTAAILAGLLILIVAPRPLAGFLDLRQARLALQAGAYSQAEMDYRSAAERLPWQPSLWERAGLAALQSGDEQAASDLLRNGERRSALTADGWLALGDIYQQAGDMPSAVQAWKQAVPGVAAYERLARAQRRLGDFSASSADLRAEIALAPENAAAHYQLGLLLAATQPDAALTELMTAARLDPDLEAGVQTLRAALNTASLSGDRAYQLVLSGRALGALGDWDLAAEAFRRAADVRPDYADAWAWLGEARQHLGQDGSAQIRKAVALDPASAMIQSLYGIYWQRQGQPQRALQAYGIAAELEPQNAAWQVALGSTYEQAGDLIAALDHYNMAVQLAPLEASAWRALAVFSITNVDDIAETGLPAARKLLSLAPDDWQSHDIAGQAMLDVDDLSEAEVQFSKAIELDSGQAAPYLHLALLYLQTENRSAAYADLLKARDLDSDGFYGFQANHLLEQYFP